ncbi:hypothetical protein ACFXG4_34245 [Nocardia sp. NPDC059246]|uniref:hypothetical protein n=1 Tax=unclassified Nocardia TaxID=2637762 RepID=UPI0036A51B50
MTDYEVGTRVPARRVRVGDRFGEHHVEFTIRGDDEGEDSRYWDPLTVIVTGGARYAAESSGTFEVPANHTVIVEVGRRGSPQFTFTCTTFWSPCSQLCPGCEQPLTVCQCTGSDRPGSWRLVPCSYLDHFASLDALGVIAAFDGPLGAFHTGPVIIHPAATGSGCHWRYPNRYAALAAIQSTD